MEATPGIPLSSFVAYLHRLAGRPVRDPADRKNAGILTTLGQIGLKLEARKKVYDVMVIDQVSKEPVEN